jgi:hypothetical protein
VRREIDKAVLEAAPQKLRRCVTSGSRLNVQFFTNGGVTPFMRVKQRVAKAVHIIAAMSLGLLAHGLVTWVGPVWAYWLNWPISIVVGLYAVAILFSKDTGSTFTGSTAQSA